MRKNILLKITSVLIVIVGICFGVNYYFFHSMAGLPKGEFIYESPSPQGTYTVMIYKTYQALSVGGTRGELVYNKTGKKRNIYWEYNRNLFEAGVRGYEVDCEDDDTVIINRIRLDLPNDTYDWRRVYNAPTGKADNA